MTFVIQEKWGFNKMSFSTFICDKIKNFVITMLIICILVPILLFLIDFSGEYLVFYLSVAMSLFIVLITILYPIVFVPLFNKLTDLEENELRAAIYADAAKA
jgi:STE24 endopeptidase